MQVLHKRASNPKPTLMGARPKQNFELYDLFVEPSAVGQSVAQPAHIKVESVGD